MNPQINAQLRKFYATFDYKSFGEDAHAKALAQ
jgi:hypothetical protein